MVVRRYEDLIAWQLSVELCDVVFDITEAGGASDDEEFRSQIRAAAQKAPALIAEGFIRYTPGEFVRYLRMARGELGEIQNHLRFARRHGYCEPEHLERAWSIARRAMITTSRLLKSKLSLLKPGSKGTKGTKRTPGT
jgi:four helix bundle protein